MQIPIQLQFLIICFYVIFLNEVFISITVYYKTQPLY